MLDPHSEVLGESPATSIIIVNYNLSREILRCIDTLDTHLPDGSYDIIVVDNHSSDSEFSQLVCMSESRPHIQVVQLDRNYGFGTACNIGASKTSTRFLCFLNPDTTVNDDFLEPLLTELSAGDSVMVGPVYDPPKLLEYSSGFFPNIFIELLSILLLGRYFEALLMAIRRRISRSWFRADWILGACMVIKKSDFDRIEGFDPDYFLFFEEVDLCKRLSDGGGRIAVRTDSRIDHVGSVSGRRDYALFTQRFYEGKLRYICKQSTGFKRATLLRLVRCQLFSQTVLWWSLSFLYPVKSSAKIQGLSQAEKFYRTITPVAANHQGHS